MDKTDEAVRVIVQAIAEYYSKVPSVEAVSMAGSIASGKSDEYSDVDVYVYSHKLVLLPERRKIAQARADRYEVGNELWEPHDAWFERDTGRAVEVVFRTTESIETELKRSIEKHEAKLGYSTGLWHSVKASEILFDRGNWYKSLKELADSPYPEPLRKAIVDMNRLAIRGLLVAPYTRQIELAIARGDLVSINHRTAAILASYFDIIFALNRLPHPGEKRLVRFVTENCALIPENFAEDLKKVLQPESTFSTLIFDINRLLDNLDILLSKDKLI